MAKQLYLITFNRILKDNNQQLYAEKITSKEIVLSNGVILSTEKDVRLCKRRVMTGHSVWKQQFDKLYSSILEERDVAEKKCRAITSTQGGINCQKLHGKTIRNNLNTGNPWNKGLKGNYPYTYAHSKETKEKISLANSGIKNGMYGKLMPDSQKELLSKLMKEKYFLENLLLTRIIETPIGMLF